MKKIKKEFDCKIERVTIREADFDLTEQNISYNGAIYEYVIISNHYIPVDQQTRIVIDLKEPETLSEFLDQKDITEKGLVDWLSKNYNH